MVSVFKNSVPSVFLRGFVFSGEDEDGGEDGGDAEEACEGGVFVVAEESQESADGRFDGHEDGGLAGGGARHAPAIEEIGEGGAEDGGAQAGEECAGGLGEAFQG